MSKAAKRNSCLVVVVCSTLFLPSGGFSFQCPTLVSSTARSDRPSIANVRHSWGHSHRSSMSGSSACSLSKQESSLGSNGTAGTSSTATPSPIATTDVLICGAGPAGLLASIMLSQKFPEYHIQVHDRLPEPPSPTDDAVWQDTSKHYLIGLGGRGITSLKTFGVWDDVVAPFCLSVPGRKDWTPETPEGKETIRTERKFVTQVLPRDKLVSLLHQHVVEQYSNQIQLVYQSQVRPVELEYRSNDQKTSSPQVLVEVTSQNATTAAKNNGEETWKPILANWVVASDGSARTFATHMEKLDSAAAVENPFRVVRFVDDNVRVYKTLPFQLPQKSWAITSMTASSLSSDDDGNNNNNNNNNSEIFWNYAVQSKGRRVIFDALPANDRGDYVGVLLLRGDDDMAKPDIDRGIFRDFLEQEIPQFLSLLNDESIAAAAKSKPSFLPQFRYVTPRMHQGQRTILLGDTAHTVKPYFGMGANSALEDVKILGECIDTSSQDLTAAIWKFSDLRTPDIGTLVRISRDLDRPGTLGIFFFLIPVILDGIFHKLAPQIFQPNIISLIQNEEYTFRDALKQKQKDRMGQLLILGGFLSSVTFAVSSVAGFIHRTVR